MDSPRKRKFIQYLTECIDQYIKEEDSLKKFKITRSNTELSITENSVKIELRPFNPENALDKLMAQSKAQAIVQKARKVKEEESAKKENMTEVVQENKPDEENIQEIQFEKHNEDHEQSTPQANDNVDTKGESPSFNRSNTYHKYSQEEKRKIIECHIAYGKEYTLVKYGIKEGTLNSLITKYNKLGEDAFKDLRSQNGRNPYTALDERLLAYIKGRRELYLPITLAMLTKEALRLNTDATFLASKGWRTNFLTRNKLAIRKRTQKVKNLMLDYHKKAENYFSVLRDIHLQDGNDVLFINFDEVSLPFNLGGSYTIEEQGVSQVPITTHNKSKETCTISSGVTSDGEIILPLIIFKIKHWKKEKRSSKKIEH